MKQYIKKNAVFPINITTYRDHEHSNNIYLYILLKLINNNNKVNMLITL